MRLRSQTAQCFWNLRGKYVPLCTLRPRLACFFYVALVDRCDWFLYHQATAEALLRGTLHYVLSFDAFCLLP